jgi:hypothetical protein
MNNCDVSIREMGISIEHTTEIVKKFSKLNY